MKNLIQLILVIPLISYFICVCIPAKKEKNISLLAINTVVIQFILTTTLAVLWGLHHFQHLNITEITVYKNIDFTFFIDLFLDKTSMTFLLVGSFLSMLVTIFSQYYMHKEGGYKRFFNTILLFYFGYNLTVLAGNFETLFMGWEILGISSFLLIAFYRDRYLPVKNAVKVFTIYRLGDIGLILAMWMSHHFWHENVTFLKMQDISLFSAHIHQHSFLGVMIALCILLAAAAKSAQFPFSFWLPRAMEGPTPSSAIFYGSLSVHMGVFLLLRVFPLLEYQLSVRVFTFLMGLFTFLAATGVSRLQSTVKSQIAYTSIAQIGLIFIEISLGWQEIALIHFTGNALLRTYQLLISPSMVAYKIREQFYYFQPIQKSLENFLPKKLENTLYTLCLKEWNLDSMLYNYTWIPIKWIGKQLNFITWKIAMTLIVPFLAVGFWLNYHSISLVTSHTFNLPILYGAIALMLALKSFSEPKSARLAFLLIVLNHLFIALSVSFNENLHMEELAIYLSGVLIAGIVGIVVIMYLKHKKEEIGLDRFYGHAFEYNTAALIFLIACLGLTGFPISPTFLGEDLMFSHIHENQVVLAMLVSISFVIDGLALIRIYAKLFMGPHSKTYHEIAYRNS